MSDQSQVQVPKIDRSQVKIVQIAIDQDTPGFNGTLYGVGADGVVYVWTGGGWRPMPMNLAPAEPRQGKQT